eukprot:comp22462_c0_seq1/m.33813 comp22462_c0_seq1/g.33813  ORF comp22462_c0_seq1/g.33813 comp22462_c0_seq1/m.33813 type:complete len:664 (-) comp22462_c0_seq1:165-2156(-)
MRDMGPVEGAQPPEVPHQRELTVRAVGVGMFVGALMCFTNMYFGLQTGWVTMGSLQTALLGYGIFQALYLLHVPGFREPLTPLEHVVLQTTAVAVATMPLAAGFVGVIPALAMLKEEEGRMVPTVLQNILWSLSVAFFGLFVAVPLRRQTILVEKLRFPSGTATAQMIEVLHGTAHCPQERAKMRRRWKLLGWSFTSSGGYSLLAYFVPVLKNMPIFTWVGLPALTEWQWTFNPALAYVGQGMIMGIKPGLSALAGSIMGWAILGPLARAQGWASGPVTDWQHGAQGWILWVALAIMLSESLVSLAITTWKVSRSYWAAFKATTADQGSVDPAPTKQQVPEWWWVCGLVASTVLCVLVDAPLFRMPIWQPLVGVLLGCVVSLMAVRALGDTDLNPVSGIGKVSQVVFGVVDPSNLVANMVGGGIAEAGAQQSGDIMQALKTNHILGGSPRAQFLAQIMGSAVSVFAAVAAYELYKNAYQIPEVVVPPSSQIWLDMARLMRDGASGLAPHVGWFVLGLGGAAAFIPIVHEIWPATEPYLPSATAFAVGMYIQPYWVLPRVAGAFVTLAVDHYTARRKAALESAGSDATSPLLAGKTEGAGEEEEEHLSKEEVEAGMSTSIIIVASGFVLGDGIISIVTAGLKSGHVDPWTCFGCPPGFCGKPCP